MAELRLLSPSMALMTLTRRAIFSESGSDMPSSRSKGLIDTGLDAVGSRIMVSPPSESTMFA